MAKLFSDGDFADSVQPKVLSESDFADGAEPGQVLSESDFADGPAQDRNDGLRQRLRQKDSLLNKIGYVKNRTKDDKPDTEGLTLDDYRNFVTSSDFNTLDEERLNLLSQAVDAKHSEVSKKRGIFRIAADSVARGIPKAIYRTAEGRMATQADSQENRDTIQSHIDAEAETDANHPRAVSGVRDIRGVGDALKLAVEVTGENVGNAVAPLAAGYVGAKAGLVTGGPVGAVIGAKVGSGIGSLSGNLGEAVRDHYTDTGKAGTSVGVVAQGLGYSVIDALLGGEATAIKHLFRGVSGEALKDAKKQFVGSIGKAALEVAKGGAKGGLGEALQSQVVGRSRRLAETGSGLEKGETGTDALWAAADEFYGGFFGDAGSSAIGVTGEYSRNKSMLKRADAVISKLSADKDIDSIKGFDKKLVSDYMLGMAAMPDVDADKQEIIRSKQAEIMDAADGQTKAVLNAYQSMFTDASFDNIPDTVKPTFNAQKAYGSKIEEADGSETYFDDVSGVMIQGREGSWSVFNRNGMKMPLGEQNTVATLKDAIGFAQDLTRLNQWRVENNQAKSEFIQKLAEKNHPGANVVMIDSPLQVKDESIRSRFIGNEQGFYNPGDNTVYVMLDAVQNPAQAAIILNHEDFHSGFDAVLRSTGKSRDELLGKTGLGDNLTAEEYLAEAYAQREQDPASYSKAKLAVQKWIGEKTGIKPMVGDAEINMLLKKVSAQNEGRPSGSVQYQPEQQSDANKIRFEDAKNGRLTLEEEAQRQNDLASDEKVSQERVINRDTKRAGLINGMNQPVEPSVVIQKPSDVPSVQADTGASEMARPASPVKDFVKTELRIDRIKEKHGDLFQQAMDVTDGDEQAATGLVSEWLAGQSIADKSVPDSVRVASKLEQRSDLSAKDADTLEQNAIFGKDLFLFGYRKDKQTGAWKFQQPIQEPAQEAPQSLPTEPVTSEPVVAGNAADARINPKDKMQRESFKSFFDAANQGGEYDLLQRWHEGGGLFGLPAENAGGEYDAYRAPPPRLRKMIRGKSKQEITAAAKELSEEFGPEYADPVIGPELMVNEFVRQYAAYQGWKENGAVPDVQADEYAKRAKYEAEQEKNDLAVLKQKVDNGEVIADGTPVYASMDESEARAAGIDPDFPAMRVQASYVKNGGLIYRLMAANGKIVDLYANKVDKQDISNEVEYDESERDYLGREDASPGLVAGQVQTDSGKDYDADERAAIEWASGLDEERIKAERAKEGVRNDGSLFAEKDIPFNLDGGTQEDVVRIAAEKKAEADRQAEAKRKLDEAPMLPGVDTEVVKESLTPEKATQNVASATTKVALKRGTKVATTRNADGVSYFGEVLQSNPDGTVKIRAFKEKTKGTVAAKTYGVDKAGNRVTKDVDVPAELVKSVDASADPSKLTESDKRRMAIGEAITRQDGEIDHSEEIRREQAAAEKDALVDRDLRFRRRTAPPPEKTVTAYKLFRVDKRNPGKLFPLFVLANDSVDIGVWLDAEEGERKGNGVKSKLGQLAYRPGWHAGDVPIATHIGDKKNKTDAKPSFRSADHVWAEIEMAADSDWQSEANKRGTNDKGVLVGRNAAITDQIPVNGFYRYKTNPNMTGTWLIGGSIKVTRILSDSEVKAINEKAGVADLPRKTPFDSAAYGFDNSNIRFRRSMAGTPSGADLLDTETGLQAARRIVQDYMQPWERKQESLQKALKKKLSDDVDVYRAEDRSYGLIRNGVHGFEKNFIEKAEKVLNDNGLTVDEFDQFLLAKAGPDRNKMIADRTDGKNLTGSGQSDTYWGNILSAYRKQGKYDKLNEAAEHVWAMNRAVLDMKVEAGLMSKAQADVWKTKSPFYVPLRSDDAEADYKELGKRASFSLKRKESKSATGRAEGHEADTPFAFSVLQSLEAVGRANKNKVYETAAKLIEQNPSDLWRVEKRIPTKQAYDAESGKAISVPDVQFEDAPNVVIVKRDGKKQYLVFEGDDGLKLARSLKKDSLQKAPVIVSALTRTYAMMRTAMVPTFILRNLRADFLQLTINMTAEGKFKMVPEVFKNMWASWVAVNSYEKTGKASGALAGYANEFFSNGGQIAGVGVQTVDKINQTLNRHVKKHGYWMKKAMKAEHFYEYIERGNATIETGTRLALYATLRKQGYSISDSIEAGKNITVNFNRKGELGPLVNSLYMFSNVAVQDAARSVKALSGKNGKAVVLGLLGAGFLAAMLNNGDDDDKDNKDGAGSYKNMPESEKQRNIIIKVGGKYVKQPIRGIWAWIYYAGTKAGDVAFGKYDASKSAKNVAGAAFDTINFLGTSGSVAQFVTPTILDPVVQHLENKDWKGDPMRQRKFTDAQPDSATGMKRTPDWIKATAKGLNKVTGGDDATKGLIDVAPETIKHVIDTLTGGLGTDASYAVGAVSDAAKGDFDVDKTPFVRDVVRDLPDSTREYYAAKDRFDEGVYQMNHYKTSKDKRRLMAESPFMKPTTAERIKNLNKTIKEIREVESKTESAERKRSLETRRLRLQSTVVALVGR